MCSDERHAASMVVATGMYPADAGSWSTRSSPDLRSCLSAPVPVPVPSPSTTPLRSSADGPPFYFSPVPPAFPPAGGESHGGASRRQGRGKSEARRGATGEDEDEGDVTASQVSVNMHSTECK